MVVVNNDEATLDVPDLGVTIRTLLACAAKGYKNNPKRVWKLRYKAVIIGSVRLKTDFIKKENLTMEET